MSNNSHIEKRAAPSHGRCELGFLQMQALWLLSKRPAHGYKLMELLSGIKHARVTQGTLYPVLAKLERMGLVRGIREGARRKKVYSLSAKGRRVAVSSCREFISIYQSIFYDYCCASCGGRKAAVAKPVGAPRPSSW